jgi:hypothetical protein
MKKTMKKTGLLCCVLLCVAGLATAQTEADFELAPDNRVVLGTTGSRMDGTYNYVTVAAGNGVVIAKYKGNRNNSTIVIPATIGGRPVVGIDWQAFSGLRMTSVTIPEGVTSIGQSAFSSCESLRSVTIPSSVTAVGYGAFHYCSLTSVTISEGVTSLGVAMFTLSRLTSVAIPASVTSIGDRAFNDINTLTSITVSPANQQYKDIDGVLFTKDGKTLVAYPGGRKGAYTVPAGVTAIGENAFASCKELTSVTLSASLATIGKQAFHYSVLKSVTIPAGVTAVSGDAF